MTAEQIGLLILGIGTLIRLLIDIKNLFFKPTEEVTNQVHENEKAFMKDLHEAQMENLKYQKQIVGELSKMNGVLSVQKVELDSLREVARSNSSEVKDLNVRVAILESK